MSISKNILKESYSNYEVLGLSGHLLPSPLSFFLLVLLFLHLSLVLIIDIEIIKLVVSYLFLRLDSELSNKVSIFNLYSLLLRGKKLIILVLLYSIANTIPFYAVKLIGAPIFTVIMQLKIFATAGFSTCMLGREYSSTKWRALVLLVIGCILVSSPIINQSTINSNTLKPSQQQQGEEEEGIISGNDLLKEEEEKITINNSFLSLISIFISLFGSGIFGLFITLIQASISGFTAVYFERLLKDKDDDTTIWERNFQLAFYSIIILLATVMYEQIGSELPTTINSTSSSSSSSDSSQSSLFHNWTYLAFIIAFLQALGGLLVAGTLRYADSVLKCFATAVSIVLTSIIGYFFLGNVVDLIVTLGYCVTVISIFNYTLDNSLILPSTQQQQTQLGGLEYQNDDEESNFKLSK